MLQLFSLIDILVHGNITSAFTDDGRNEKKDLLKKIKNEWAEQPW